MLRRWKYIVMWPRNLHAFLWLHYACIHGFSLSCVHSLLSCLLASCVAGLQSFQDGYQCVTITSRLTLATGTCHCGWFIAVCLFVNLSWKGSGNNCHLFRWCIMGRLVSHKPMWQKLSSFSFPASISIWQGHKRHLWTVGLGLETT